MRAGSHPPRRLPRRAWRNARQLNGPPEARYADELVRPPPPLAWKARALVVAATAALVITGDGACRVTSKLEDCERDGDCAGNERCNEAGKFCERLPKLVIGVSMGQTGTLASLARIILSGLELAVATINAEGGVLGTPLALEVLDDQSDDALAVQNTRTLVDRGVIAVIGPLRSSQMLAAQSATRDANIVHLSTIAGATALAQSQPETDRYLFQTITSIRRGSAAAIVRYAASAEGKSACTKMAVLHTDDVTGNEYRDSIRSLLSKNGGCMTVDVAFPPEKKGDYVAEVKKLVDAKPQCAALVALPAAGAAILREFDTQIASDRKTWASFTWFGTTTLHTPDFLVAARHDKANATPTFAEGFMGADVDGAPATSEYADYRFLYQNAHAGEEPPALSAHAFDAVALIALAVELAGNIHDRVAIRNAIYDVSRDGDRVPAFGPGNVGDALRAVRRKLKINYQGASSRIELDGRGVVGNPTLIWLVKNGELAPVVRRYSEVEMSALDDPAKTLTTCP
jgi:ABC-type branched-subunit amino acid transport system substrate-binding protein